MKRKGLIVSSIVMVVVLIASLTTATYAWFSNTSSAKLDSMTVNTVASSGLQIGSIDYSTGEIKSGTVALSNGIFQGDTDGPGANLDFASATAAGFYAASGNGEVNYDAEVNMWASVGNKVDANDKPESIEAATTSQVLYIDFVVFNQQYSTEKAGLAIKAFNISINGATEPEATIAASTRIAILAAPAVADATVTKFVAADESKLKPFCMIEPYSNIKKGVGSGFSTKETDTGRYLNNTNTAGEYKPYKTADPDNRGFYGDRTALKAIYKTSAGTNGDMYFQHKSPDSESNVNLASAFPALNISAIGTGLTGAKKVQSDTVSNAIYVGDYGSADTPCIALRLVIWFEGEDPQCRTINARGKGINVSLEFGTCAIPS